jgi:hypothetical protein
VIAFWTVIITLIRIEDHAEANEIGIADPPLADAAPRDPRASVARQFSK